MAKPRRTWIENVLILVVTVVWAASFIADFTVKGFSPSPFVNGMMLFVVGAVLGVKVVRQGRDDDQ